MREALRATYWASRAQYPTSPRKGAVAGAILAPMPDEPEGARARFARAILAPIPDEPQKSEGRFGLPTGRNRH